MIRQRNVRLTRRSRRTRRHSHAPHSRKFHRRFQRLLTAAGADRLTASESYLNARNEAHQLEIERVEIPIGDLHPALEGLRIVHMSDFHLRPFTPLSLVEQAVALANSLQPDVTVLTGDYVWHDVEDIFELAPTLAGLDARLGVFTVLGNHDVWTNPTVVREAFTAHGLPVLHNEGRALGVGRSRLYLAGVDDGWSGRPDVEAALNGRPKDATTVLLAHEPDLADDFAGSGRIDLQLSGHTHGGQVQLRNYGPLLLPYLGKKYDQGLHRVDGMWVYTTRGVGVTGVPYRLNCPPEVTLLTLVAR